ncbi:MAG: Gp15 family bacteriophage protein [Ruminococcus sp.]|nr:Gp15 family bacteriophage protein [Ruminococcus sp.]
MIGELPTGLIVDDKEYPINSDFRIALLIFQAFNDRELNDYCKTMVCLKCLYKNIPCNIEKAVKKALWFLDGGNMPKSKQSPKKMLDWEQDESIIFPAVNKVAGYETRTVDYLHWWTFLGLFNEIGEGLFSQVMNIRSKKAKGKKLEKWEKEFYREHQEMIDLKDKLTAEEQAEVDFISSIV